MAVLPTDKYKPTRPQSRLEGTNDLEIAKIEFTGEVAEAYRANRVLSPLFSWQKFGDAPTITKDAIGTATWDVISRDNVPAPQVAEFSNQALTVDKVILARHDLFKYDILHTKYEVKSKIAKEQGESVAEAEEKAVAYKLARAALATRSSYYDTAQSKELAGHGGGTQLTVTNAEVTDPDVLMNKLFQLVINMESGRNIDPIRDGVKIALHPIEFGLLMQAEKLINRDYITSDGTSQSGWALKVFDVPIIKAPFFPRANVTNFKLHSTLNPYNGDYSKLRALAFTQDTLWGGNSEGVTTSQWFDDYSKHYFIDTTRSFVVGTDRHETAGALVISP